MGREFGDMRIYIWLSPFFGLTWNYHNTVNWLYPNTKYKVKKKSSYFSFILSPDCFLRTELEESGKMVRDSGQIQVSQNDGLEIHKHLKTKPSEETTLQTRHSLKAWTVSSMLLLCMNQLLGLHPHSYDVSCSLPPSTCISRADFLVFRVMRLLTWSPSIPEPGKT